MLVEFGFRVVLVRISTEFEFGAGAARPIPRPSAEKQSKKNMVLNFTVFLRRIVGFFISSSMLERQIVDLTIPGGALGKMARKKYTNDE
jgi:hypothetical protein